MPLPSTKKTSMPEFRSEEEERKFWAGHDSTEFIDWQTAPHRKFPNPKPSLRTISFAAACLYDRGSESPG
jgi:hypothetical protein